MEYKSAYAYSKAYCTDKNKELLDKYISFFDKKGLEYKNIENFKNCLLFAGALFDELNDGLPEWKLEQRYHARLDHQGAIKFDADDMELIEKNIELLAETLKEVDEKNKGQYENVRLVANQALSDIYEEENQSKDKEDKLF